MTELTKYLPLLPSPPPSNIPVHSTESCLSFLHTPVYVSLGRDDYGLGYGKDEVGKEGLFVKFVHERVALPASEAPSTSDPKTISEALYESSKATHETITTTFLVILDGNGNETSSTPITKSGVDAEIAALVSEGSAPLTQCVKTLINATPAGITNLIPPVVFSDDVKVTKHKTLDQNLEYPIPKDKTTWTCGLKPEEYKNDGNLWLNLSDGFIGGGRKNWDGSGGTGGGLEHYEQTGKTRPLAVKITTLNATLSGVDCYSYDEDDMVAIPNLRELLETLGVDYKSMTKTSKTTSEMEVELNLNYDFSAITEEGAKLIPVNCAGVTGLKNLGNSCYMNSVLQMVACVNEVGEKYEDYVDKWTPAASPNPDKDLGVQMGKVIKAIRTGGYGPVRTIDEASKIEEEGGEVKDEDVDPSNPLTQVAPSMFKLAASGGKSEWVGGQQQDAGEYLRHLLEGMEKHEGAAGENSRKLFEFGAVKEMVCGEDGKKMYKDQEGDVIMDLRVPMEKAKRKVKAVEKEGEGDEGGGKKAKTEEEPPAVSLQECLEGYVSQSVMEGYKWKHLGDKVADAYVKTGITNFPPYLVLAVGRYEVDQTTWTPKKLKVDVEVPMSIDLGFMKMTKEEGEMVIQEEEGGGGGGVEVNPVYLQQLVDMGFGENGCKKALIETGGKDIEAAMNWVMEHMGDANFNDPVVEGGGGGGGDNEYAEVVSEIFAMGMFQLEHVKAAVKWAKGEQARAADWLFNNMDGIDEKIKGITVEEESKEKPPPTPLLDGPSCYTLQAFVSHIGPNTNSGHYVAHCLKEGRWVILNDEKTALSVKPPKEKGFIYLFKRN